MIVNGTEWYCKVLIVSNSTEGTDGMKWYRLYQLYTMVLIVWNGIHIYVTGLKWYGTIRGWYQIDTGST